MGTLLLLAACGGGGEEPVAGSRPIACRMAGAAAFEGICTVERVASPQGPVLVLRAPDGSFQRVLLVRDGRGVVAADGALAVKVTPVGAGGIDVLAGETIYRLPAKIAP